MKSDNPLSFRNILAGIIITVIGGIILAIINQDARFAPTAQPTAPTALIQSTITSALVTEPAPTIQQVTLAPPVTLRSSDGLTLSSDDFSDGILDTKTLWNDPNCKQSGSTVSEHDGQLWFKLQTTSLPWEDCSLPLKQAPTVRKVSAHAVLTRGKDDLSWIGILAYCGGTWLNFMISPAGVGFEGGEIQGQKIERTYIETGTFDLPITRTLSIEWLNDQLRLNIVDSNKQASLPCTKPPAFVNFGAGANLGGYVDGAIDDVQVWRVSP